MHQLQERQRLRAKLEARNNLHPGKITIYAEEGEAGWYHTKLNKMLHAAGPINEEMIAEIDSAINRLVAREETAT